MENGLISREYMIERIRNSGYAEQIKSNLYLMARMAPAVDAVEVRHGRWTRKRTVEHDGELYCSLCGEAALFIDWREEWKSNFCPYCGARMDGRREDVSDARNPSV